MEKKALNFLRLNDKASISVIISRETCKFTSEGNSVKVARVLKKNRIKTCLKKVNASFHFWSGSGMGLCVSPIFGC